MNARSVTTAVVLASLFSYLPAQAQDSDADQPSFLQQFLDSLALDSDSPSDDLDAEFTNDLDLELDLAALADGPLDIPEGNTVEIPPPPSAVFHKQPEDDVFEVPMREIFPFEAFDYDQGTPTLYCMPARVCSVELEPGEVLLGRAMGDPDRWLYQELTAGPADATRVLLAFMPKSFGARTNLVLTTDRRVYTLALASAEIDRAGDAASAPLTERARFTYPQAWAASRQRPVPKPLVVKDMPVADAGNAIQPSTSPADLNFHYTVVDPTKVKRRFGWKPTVYDDGQFTYVLLPQRLPSLPAIRGRDQNREPFLLNEIYHHHAHGTYIEIPRLSNVLELILGAGRAQQVMTIYRNVRLP